MYETTTKHISQGPHPQYMPCVRLLIFFTCPTIVSLWAKRNSCFPGTGLPVEVKRTVGGRRGSCNLPSRCCLFSFSSGIKCFFTMSIVSTTLTKFPLWKEFWTLFAYEKPKCSRAMKPFCLLKIQSLRLRPLLYPRAKERQYHVWWILASQ
jgi:hypothetical protein